MSKIEELIYSALEHGKRSELFSVVGDIKDQNPHTPLEDIYEKAYQQVMKT